MDEFIPGKTKISVSGPQINEVDITELHRVIDKGWFTEGTRCSEFRSKLRFASGKKFVHLVNSGSSASLLAMTLLKKRKKKYVITCATGFPTTVAPIYQCGMIPIYIDMNPDTLSPDMIQLNKVLSMFGDNTAGIIFAHTLGFPFREDTLRKHLHKYQLDDMPIIIDACDALGARILGDPVGFWADIVTYSFFPAHQICAIEGGAICTNNFEYDRELEQLSRWGRSCFCIPGQQNACGKRFEQNYPTLPEGWDHKYTFTTLGYNMGITEFQGSLGSTQMDRLVEFTGSRITRYEYLLNHLRDLKDKLDFVTVQNDVVSSPFGFPILLKEGSLKDFVMYLKENKIDTRPVFAGNITRQPGFSELEFECFGLLEGSNLIMEKMIWIGCHPALTYEMLDYVVEVIHKYFEDK